jgi:phage terminase small subunit
MNDSLSPRQKAFADFWITGMPARRAYQLAGYKVRGNSAAVQACVALKNPKIVAYIKAERQVLAELARLEKWEIIKFLQDVITTPIGRLDETSPLVQEMTREEIGGNVVRVKIKIVSKMDAAKQLAFLMGWNAPEQVEIDATKKLADLLRRIRLR